MAQFADWSRSDQAATARLSAWCANVPRQWSALSLQAAQRAFVDTLGVILAGQGEACTVSTRLAVAAWGSGPCYVAGGARSAAPWAALVNGTAAHALDYDDALDPAMSHPSAVLVPALLAIAETQAASGADVLDAYLVGFEVMTRLGEAMNLVHYNRGWHTTLSIGSIAVAASCARLLRADASTIAMAISVATSMAAGSKRQFGTMVKPLHAGLAAKNGLVAAQLASCGLTGVAEPLQGRWGYLDLMAGDEAPGMEAALSHLGNPLAIEQYGVMTKYYPCCYSTHRPVDALRSLSLKPEQVAAIRAEVSEVAQANLRYRVPRNPNEARFSLPYCLTAALFDGTLTLGSFLPDAIARPALVPLMERVEVMMDPQQTGDRPVTETTERGSVEVMLSDGAVRRAAVTIPRGHPQAPLTEVELEAKFRDCASRALAPDKIDHMLERLAGFGRLDRVSELTADLSS